jgi:hypothetical protein
MHDIDRALFEAESELGHEYEFGEAGEYELGEAGEYGAGEGESPDRATELAGELLELSGEQELDRFLGDLISSAVSGVRDFARSDVGRAVGGVLKSAAQRALPQLGRMAGNALAPGRGGDLGQRAGQWLGGRLELAPETEAMSAEDREFEAARAFVRFAEETARRAADDANAGQAPPSVTARRAAAASARTHLPGLLRPPAGGAGPEAPAQEGRWVRRGRRVVVFGL